MKKIPPAPILPRGRVTTWSREQIDKLTTPDLKALLANAERLQETEVATLCRAILTARPRGNNAASRLVKAAAAAK
jgi:hypothetical protein